MIALNFFMMYSGTKIGVSTLMVSNFTVSGQRILHGNFSLPARPSEIVLWVSVFIEVAVSSVSCTSQYFTN